MPELLRQAFYHGLYARIIHDGRSPMARAVDLLCHYIGMGGYVLPISAGLFISHLKHCADFSFRIFTKNQDMPSSNNGNTPAFS